MLYIYRVKENFNFKETRAIEDVDLFTDATMGAHHPGDTMKDIMVTRVDHQGEVHGGEEVVAEVALGVEKE